MNAFNRLLSDQVKKYLGEDDVLPEEFSNLLKEISNTYSTFESNQLLNDDLLLDFRKESSELNGRIILNSTELTKAKSELNRIFNVVSEGFYSRDLINNEYNYLSAGCQRIYGYSLDDFKNNVMLWYEVVHPEDRKIIDSDNKKLLKGETINSEYRIILKDNSIRWVEVTVVPVFAEGKLSQVDGIIKNITERRVYEQKLERQNQELTKTNAELDRFVYSASHELRSPLTSILGLVTLTKQHSTKSDRNKFVNMIESCVLSLDAFIKDIIEYSKNSRVEVEQDEIKFSSLLEEIKNPLNYLIETEKIGVEINISQENIFYSDRKRIAVLFNNLFSNAIKYCDSSKSKSYIHIDIKSDENELKLIFTDNGIGIPKEKLSKIFQMFYRANSDKTGSGLGLYIVKEILERIGGEISVESEWGKRTSFFVKIPNVNSATHSAVNL